MRRDSPYSNMFAQTHVVTVLLAGHPFSNVSTLTYAILTEFFLAFLELLKTKQKAKKRKRERATWLRKRLREGWLRDTSIIMSNACNSCDSHKYRLVFFEQPGENDKYKQGERRVSLDTFLIYVHVFVAADEQQHRLLFHFLRSIFSSPRRYGHHFATARASMLAPAFSWSAFRRTKVHNVHKRRLLYIFYPYIELNWWRWWWWWCCCCWSRHWMNSFRCEILADRLSCAHEYTANQRNESNGKSESMCTPSTARIGYIEGNEQMR